MRLFRNIIFFAAAMAGLLVLLQWMQYRLLVIDHSVEIYVAGIAIIFTILGIWLARRLSTPKKEPVRETIVVEKEVPVYVAAADFHANETMIRSLGISEREIQVLELMAGGATNQQIADALFVSVNTVKTHSSRLFEKLDVQRRTQAVEKAKRLGIIR